MKKLFGHGKKKIVLMMACMACIGTFAATMALLLHVTETKANYFSNGIVNIKIDENFSGGDIRDGLVSKKVRVMNSSENEKLRVVPVYIRVQIVSNWKADDGTIMAVDTDKLVSYKYAQSNNWVEGDDGYFYYTKAVTADQYTDYLLEGVEKSAGVTLPEEGNLDVQILADAVQTTGDALADTWGTPTVGGKEIKFTQ